MEIRQSYYRLMSTMEFPILVRQIFISNLVSVYWNGPLLCYAPKEWRIIPGQQTVFMPPPLGAGGIMFSGCPSVRPKPEIPSFDLYMGLLVHPTNRDRFTACPSVRLSVHTNKLIKKGFTINCLENTTKKCLGKHSWIAKKYKGLTMQNLYWCRKYQ